MDSRPDEAHDIVGGMAKCNLSENQVTILKKDDNAKMVLNDTTDNCDTRNDINGCDIPRKDQEDSHKGSLEARTPNERTFNSVDREDLIIYDGQYDCDRSHQDSLGRQSSCSK